MKTAAKIRHKGPSQKWPRGPRFTAGSVTGYSVSRDTSPSLTSPPGRPATTIWYVHDAAYGYHVVGTFYDYRVFDHYDGRVFKRRLNQTAEQAARHYALILNRRDKA